MASYKTVQHATPWRLCVNTCNSLSELSIGMTTERHRFQFPISDFGFRFSDFLLSRRSCLGEDGSDLVAVRKDFRVSDLGWAPLCILRSPLSKLACRSPLSALQRLWTLDFGPTQFPPLSPMANRNLRRLRHRPANLHRHQHRKPVRAILPRRFTVNGWIGHEKAPQSTKSAINLCAAQTESPVGTADSSPGQVSHRTPPWVNRVPIQHHFADAVGASSGEHHAALGMGVTANYAKYATKAPNRNSCHKSPQRAQRNDFHREICEIRETRSRYSFGHGFPPSDFLRIWGGLRSAFSALRSPSWLVALLSPHCNDFGPFPPLRPEGRDRQKMSIAWTLYAVTK
jgi:hypothetical protein